MHRNQKEKIINKEKKKSKEHTVSGVAAFQSLLGSGEV